MPILRNGYKEESLNYRVVPLISILCKICEQLIKIQWTDYLQREGIIDEVHKTYHRSVEMCFGFYEANHLCQREAFT